MWREVDILNKLGRLVAYKIYQIRLLSSKAISHEQWNKIEASFKRENHYAGSTGIRPLHNSYERTMWSYYELLETISLKKIENFKAQVYEQIRAIELKRKFNLE